MAQTLKRWQQQDQTRQRGLALLQAGKTPTEVHHTVGVSRTTVYAWQRRGTGKEASIRPSGRKSKLTLGQRRRLEGILERGPVARGWTTEVWTSERIAQVIRQEFRIRYHPYSLPYLLHTWGWSCQKPGRRAAERNEAAITRWVQGTWPRLKKRRSRGA